MVIFIYLAIVLLSVTQSASTKLFNRRSSNSSVFNTTKALSSFVLFFLMALGGFELHLPTLLFGLLYGAFLCLSMYTGYKALCLGPMALTSMLVSFSIIVPLIWGVTFGNEDLSMLKIVALLLLFASIILTNADKIFSKGDIKGSSNNSISGGKGKWMLYVGMTFLCNGGCSILQKQHQELYPNSYSSMFMFFAMLLCTIIFSAIVLSKNSIAEIKATKGKWLGVVSGVANGGAAFLTLILAGSENASVLFPIISAGTLLGAILCGRILFKEKLRINHYFALGFGMLAVVLMKL
jgi:drug/metabolite transporter (DMT)-like permease